MNTHAPSFMTTVCFYRQAAGNKWKSAEQSRTLLSYRRSFIHKALGRQKNEDSLKKSKKKNISTEA